MQALEKKGCGSVSEKRKTQLRGKAFFIFAIGFNSFGLANLELGLVPISGNVPAAGALLTSSLVCLLISLFYPKTAESSQTEKEKKEEAA